MLNQWPYQQLQEPSELKGVVSEEEVQEDPSTATEGRKN